MVPGTQQGPAPITSLLLSLGGADSLSLSEEVEENEDSSRERLSSLYTQPLQS